jgi:hypothetical protein
MALWRVYAITILAIVSASRLFHHTCHHHDAPRLIDKVLRTVLLNPIGISETLPGARHVVSCKLYGDSIGYSLSKMKYK